MLEREPRLREDTARGLAASGQARAGRTVEPSTASRPSRSALTLGPRETRLRQRVDQVLDRCAKKERRILVLEELVRAGGTSERELVLERRLNHARQRISALNEELREARNVA